MNTPPSEQLRGVADRLLWLMREVGLKQRELDRHAGLEEGTFAALLSRVRRAPAAGITQGTLVQYADAFGGPDANVTLDWLVRGTGVGPNMAAVRAHIETTRAEAHARAIATNDAHEPKAVAS